MSKLLYKVEVFSSSWLVRNITTGKAVMEGALPYYPDMRLDRALNQVELAETDEGVRECLKGWRDKEPEAENAQHGEG